MFRNRYRLDVKMDSVPSGNVRGKPIISLYCRPQSQWDVIFITCSLGAAMGLCRDAIFVSALSVRADKDHKRGSQTDRRWGGEKQGLDDDDEEKKRSNNKVYFK